MRIVIIAVLALTVVTPAAAQIAGLDDHPTVCLRSSTTGLTYCNDFRGGDTTTDMTGGGGRADQMVAVYKNNTEPGLVPTYRIRETRGRVWYDRHH
jgi:hypothetical protein